MSLINDKTCGWINSLSPRNNIKVLKNNYNCDWIIIGAGFTGLSAARKLGEINPNEKIVLIDAQLAGEGASSRNSGYLVDSTLNDGFTSNKNFKEYKEKVDIYNLGIKSIKKFIKEHQVECDWNECGKYFASSRIEDEKKLKNFSKTLSLLNIENKFLFKKDLLKKLGTDFYKISVYTKGGILLNPGKLARAMVDTLPKNVTLYENTKLLNWKRENNLISCIFEKGKILGSKIIFCTNGYLSSLGIEKNYSFPLTLSASMTRPLTESEFSSIGRPKEWGVLPVRAMGATVRMTKDRRILIRNTAEILNKSVEQNKIKRLGEFHKLGIQKRFPQLPLDIIESTWSGVACRSGNSSQIFKKIYNNVFATGCYNGSGIGVGTLFGEQIALKASNINSDEIKIIEKRKKPIWLPPQPFLNLGIRTRLFFERIKARTEI